MKENKQENEIMKDAVVGFVVTMGTSGYCYTHPLIGSWGESPELYNDPIDFDSEERVIGVLPAPPNTFKIYGCNPLSNECFELGYEYEGAHHPDWVDEYEKKKEVIRRNNLPPPLMDCRRALP